MLTLTDNRQTMISVRREQGGYRLRLHHMFLDADPEVVRALARYVHANDRQASRALGRFIDSNQAKIKRLPRRRRGARVLRSRGQVHDLQEIFDQLNRQHFEGSVDARIAWGTASPRRCRRSSIKMGSYSVEERLIHIHPSLDRLFVPRYFVEWIVFHEMLHQVHEIPVVGGRRQFHTPAFLEQERGFADYRRARQWERAHLHRILSF
jgi:hypothetical protein